MRGKAAKKLRRVASMVYQDTGRKDGEGWYPLYRSLKKDWMQLNHKKKGELSK